MKRFNNEKKEYITKSYHKILIGGEISIPILKERMQFLKPFNENENFLQKSKKEKMKAYEMFYKEKINTLYIEIDYFDNFEKQKNILNDFLFNICIFKYFDFDEEPFFLPENIKILIEVKSYFDNFLMKNICLLKNFINKEIVFDKNLIDFEHDQQFKEDLQIFAYFDKKILRGNFLEELPFEPTNNLISKSSYYGKVKIQNSIRSEIENSNFKLVINSAIDKHFIEPLKKENIIPTFALLKTFILIASYELRNINKNFYFYFTQLKQKKKQIMEFITSLIISNIKPSYDSLENQKIAQKRYINN